MLVMSCQRSYYCRWLWFELLKQLALVDPGKCCPDVPAAVAIGESDMTTVIGHDNGWQPLSGCARQGSSGTHAGHLLIDD